jgi:hypothetical protein
MSIPVPDLKAQQEFLERLNILAGLQKEGANSQDDFSVLIQSILHDFFTAKAAAA